MFDQLVNDAAVRFNVPESSTSSLLRGLLALITSNNRTGGAEGFVDRFRRAGLADIVTSWFGGREGRSLTPVQLEAALGSAALDRLAGDSGLTRGTAASALTYMLPKVIGRLTPGGTLPSMNTIVSQLSGYLDRPPTVDRAVTSERPRAPIPPRQGWRAPGWLPGAVVAAFAVAGLLWLRGQGGTIEPELTLSNRDGQIAYSGVVRDEETRTVVRNALRSTFGWSHVAGDVRVDRRVKRANWLPRVGHLLPTVRTSGVTLSISGNRVNVNGGMSDVERQALRDRVRGILGPAASIGTLADAEADAVRAANHRALTALRAVGTSGVRPDALIEALNMTVINFPSGSARIPADGLDVIRTSAQALRRAPFESIIEIQGHTDNTGDPVRNLALSQARAEAVRDALVEAGAPPALLRARGYGGTSPRASNDSDDGRLQNRRIEYRLLPAGTAGGRQR